MPPFLRHAPNAVPSLSPAALRSRSLSVHPRRIRPLLRLGASRSIAARYCWRDARPVDTRNRCSTRLVEFVLNRPAFAAKKHLASRSVLGLALVALEDFRFAPGRA